MAQETHRMAWCGAIAPNPFDTVVHLYPSSGALTAPYAVNCSLTVYAPGESPRTTPLDGMKMSQPDGFRARELLAAHDSLQEWVPVVLEISTNHQRLNVGASLCWFEYRSRHGTARCRAYQLRAYQHHAQRAAEDRRIEGGFVESLRERGISLSLLAVNSSPTSVTLSSARGATEIPAGSSREVAADFLRGVDPSLRDQCAWYVVHRTSGGDLIGMEAW